MSTYRAAFAHAMSSRGERARFLSDPLAYLRSFEKALRPTPSVPENGKAV